MNLRTAVIQKMQNSSSNDIFKTISDAINSQNEQTLPGLGVLLELYWNNISPSDKQNICSELSNLLQK